MSVQYAHYLSVLWIYQPISVSLNKDTAFSYRWPGFLLLCSCSFTWSSNSSSSTSFHGLQVTSAQSKPVRPTPTRLQHQPPTLRTFGSLWLRQKLQRVLCVFGSLGWQHTEWSLQDSSSWVYSTLKSKVNSATTCEILSVFFCMSL